MKTLMLTLSLILMLEVRVSACDLSKIMELHKFGEEFKKDFDNDDDFKEIAGASKSAQKHDSSNLMLPVDPKSNDLHSVGIIEAISNYEPDKLTQGTAYKISKQCILTAAHILYRSLKTPITSETRAPFDGKITFKRLDGSAERNANVFFKMTAEDDDFTIEEGDELIEKDGKKEIKRGVKRRSFYGHSDLVILQLDKGDDHFKNVNIFSPEKLFNGVDKLTGRKISCMGSPRHMTKTKGKVKFYGDCKGTDFLWEQRSARVFENDGNSKARIDEGRGFITNAAFTPGISGGPCKIENGLDEVFGIASNGTIVDENAIDIMPNLIYPYRQYVPEGARYIAGLHVLDKRLRSARGVGLSEIAKICDQ